MAKRRVRIRSKRLTEISEDRLALAVWLIARDLVEDKTTLPASDAGEVEMPIEADEDAS